MDPSIACSVSNLTPMWEDDIPAELLEEAPAHRSDSPLSRSFAATVVEQAVHAELAGRHVTMVTPPMEFASSPQPDEPSIIEAVERPIVYDLLAEPVEVDLDEPDLVDLDEPFDERSYDLLRRRDIAREVLRARLLAIAEQRETRSAYEIVFILLAIAVMILLAAPPLVQVLLAANGIQS